MWVNCNASVAHVLGNKKTSFCFVLRFAGLWNGLTKSAEHEGTILGFAAVLKFMCALPDRKALAGIKKALQRIKWLRRRAE